MLSAILTTFAALVVLGVILAVVFRVRANSAHSRAADRMRVRSVTSVGIAAETPKTTHSAAPSGPSMGGGVAAGEGLRNRFTAVGVIALGIFGALTAKLFGLQIIEAASYSEEADANLYTTVNTPAPRGVIYDANGIAMVANRQVQTVLADADVAKNSDVILRLSSLLGIPYEVVRSRILDSSSGAQSQRVVASDVKLRDIAYISEHRDAFPGVSTQIRTTRTYPYGAMAAHALGYTGTASEDDLKNAAEGRDIQSGDAVGKSGIEQTYDSLLAGDHGQRVLVTNAAGVVQQVVGETAPSKGNDVYLTIDAKVQHVADRVLQDAVRHGTGTAASCVVMDVNTGGIVALSNYPTYAPEHFIGGISQDMWDAYQTEESHYPLMNRVIAGTYPAASCFKAFTSLAGLTYGFAGIVRAPGRVLATASRRSAGKSQVMGCWACVRASSFPATLCSMKSQRASTMPAPPSVMRPCKISLRNLAIRLLQRSTFPVKRRVVFPRLHGKRNISKTSPKKPSGCPAICRTWLSARAMSWLLPFRWFVLMARLQRESSCVRIC